MRIFVWIYICTFVFVCMYLCACVHVYIRVCLCVFSLPCIGEIKWIYDYQCTTNAMYITLCTNIGFNWQPSFIHFVFGKNWNMSNQKALLYDSHFSRLPRKYWDDADAILHGSGLCRTIRHRVPKKRHQTGGRNSVISLPIFKTLSLTYSAVNLQHSDN